MTSDENPFAGQGAVLLDIGDDIGALVVTMPAEMEGVEVEIRPRRGHHADQETPGDSHDHGDHGLEAPDHDHGHPPHVAVVARPADGRVVHSLVFPELLAGSYELYQRPAGPVELTVSITGGHVTEAAWPASA